MPRKSGDQIVAEAFRTPEKPRNPPTHLRADAKAMWREITRDRPSGWFRPGSYELLASYCCFSVEPPAKVVIADQLAQILRVKPRRQRRRANEIAKHHRQLAPFGLDGSRCIRGCRRHRGAECGDGIVQPTAIADQSDAGVFQILHGQARQYVNLDPVLPKNLIVPFEPQALQPSRYVHAVIPDSEERQAPHGRG
jgi:hypothetical protein